MVPYKINIDFEQGFINLKYSGIVILQDRKTAREEVFDLCREHNLSRSLVETHESDIKMTESEVVNFASGFENVELPPDYRLACVVTSDSRGDRLLEIIISLDGINVKYFLERDEALAWLLAV